MKVLQREADLAIAVFISDWREPVRPPNWKGYGNFPVIDAFVVVVVANDSATGVKSLNLHSFHWYQLL